ncbi:MAG: 4Fe-4S binding protein [Thermoplasmata archaeon]
MRRELRSYKDLPPGPITFETTRGFFKTGSWRTFRPVVELAKCKKCWICWKFCPDVSVRIREDGKGVEFDYDHCKGCGICANECPAGAIQMVPEE